MHEISGAQMFHEIPSDTQSQIKRIGRQMTGLAKDYAVPIIYAPPLHVRGKINGATGCIVQLSTGTFLVTASHVLDKYEERTQSGEQLNWQVGNLHPYDPLPRVAWRSRERDVVFLRFLENEISQIGPCLIAAPQQWPPAQPQVGDMIVAAGYPKVSREVDTSLGSIDPGAYSGAFVIASVNQEYYMCQIDHSNVISFNELPPPSQDLKLGGISGGPVLLVNKLSYPLIGIITQSSPPIGTTYFLRVANFQNIQF